MPWPRLTYFPRLSIMFYTHSALDRSDHLRADQQQLDSLAHNAKARIVPVWQAKSLVSTPSDTSPPSACYLSHDALSDGDWPLIFLGLLNDNAYFALDISHLSEADSASLSESAMTQDGSPVQTPTTFADLRTIGPALSAEEGALLVYARAIIYWNDNARFCTRCGHALHSFNAGHAKRCLQESCGNVVFPRTDPAVIMLVTHQSAPDAEPVCLLGRSAAWPEGVFSTLAGFVEAGESLEMAVQREVLEEASIRTTNVRYVASQPWPFPRSIMLGFEATALNTHIQVDTLELADAQWFTREQLNGFGEWGDEGSQYKLPRKDSIARHLVERWMNGDSGS